MNIQNRILKFVALSNWVLLLITSAAGAIIAKFDFTLGIITGGLIVTINFHLMYRTLKKTFTPPHISSIRAVIVKHYIRFAFSEIIIFILISKNYVEPAGLLIGLSVVVASIMLAALCEFKNIIFKEAI